MIDKLNGVQFTGKAAKNLPAQKPEKENKQEQPKQVVVVSKDGAKITVDPAMADYGKLYSGFDENFVEEMKRLIAKADYALPNITESAFLTGTEYRETHHTKEYIEKLCVGIKELGAKNVVLKGVNFKDGEIGVATYDGNETEVSLWQDREDAEGSARNRIIQVSRRTAFPAGGV